MIGETSVDPRLTPLIVSRRFAVEALIAGVATAGAVIARLIVEYIVGGVAPFVLTFPAVMLATLVGGGRAGVIVAVSCQLLTIRYVFPNWVSPHGGVTTDLANVILSTLALAAIVWATESYRRAAAMLGARAEQQIHTLSLLNAEMDHRTKNNFQIAAGLLAHQSLSALDPAVALELNKAASRLETIASIYHDLPTQLDHTKTVNLANHLNRIVFLLRAGAVPDHIIIQYRADHIQVSSDVAVVAGLIVNEWVTNALQHAFNNSPGTISVDVTKQGGQIHVMVTDNGRNHSSPNTSHSRGGSLMTALAKAVQAQVTTVYHNGARCMLAIPDRDSSARI